MKKERLLLLIILVLLKFIPGYAQVDHWETAVYAEDEWRYFPGTFQLPDNWVALGFNDNDWPSGPGSIGYGDGDDNTIIDPIPSLFMRHRFNVVDKSKIKLAFFHADYDDGFIAYLNGVEIARANMSGNFPPYDADADDYREAEMYSGGLPEAFPLSFASLQDILQDGENILSIQTHNLDGVFSSDLTALYWLSFGINDSSNDYGTPPPWFMLNTEFDTPLPIVKIDTGGEYIPDEPKIDGQMGIIWNEDGTPNNSSDLPNDFLGPIAIERRGQTSLFLFPKNGYSFETRDESGEDVDVTFLNFPEEEDWVLHGPYSDKTLLRNVLAMELARSTGQYASRTRIVELLINDQYEGIYILMERIKRDDNRVAIANLREEDISGDELTGGYVFKIDKGEFDWISQYDIAYNPGERLRFQYVSPNRDQIQPEQEAYIQSYVDSMETALLSPDIPYAGKRYDEYLDLESFADHFLISELTKEVDAYRISSFYHKDKDSNGGLLKAGPVWDFNLAFSNADYCNAALYEGWMYDEHCDTGNPFWWENMRQDPAFRNRVKCRWEAFRAGPFHLDTIFAFIDQQTALAAPALERNFQRWPVLDEYVWPNVIVTESHEQEIIFLKNFIAGRLAWMDNNMFGECIATNTFSSSEPTDIRLYPNPASVSFSLESNVPLAETLDIQLLDVLGRKIDIAQQYAKWSAGSSMMTINLLDLNLAAGCYFVQITSNKLLIGNHKLVIR